MDGNQVQPVSLGSLGSGISEANRDGWAFGNVLMSPANPSAHPPSYGAMSLQEKSGFGSSQDYFGVANTDSVVLELENLSILASNAPPVVSSSSFGYDGRLDYSDERHLALDIMESLSLNSSEHNRQHMEPYRRDSQTVGLRNGGSLDGFKESGEQQLDGRASATCQASGDQARQNRRPAANGVVAQPGRDARNSKATRYRRLWREVTRINRGQKLGNSGGLAFADTTVEDLLEIVANLGPKDSTVNAIAEGLSYLDSSATAAFLKELGKQGHAKRSVEIFDWLRSLPDTHELSQLCDLYTYTTMISQCGSHQQLRRAMELVAEMRSRGIKGNVHTFSALMNVCMKSNELDLVEDVYKQMLEENCSPNLVTYNILIDVCVKKGQWEEAVNLLAQLEEQGIQAEARTYNTVISACNKSGQPERALKMYDKMLANGIKPSATTFTLLITVHGRKGQVDMAFEIFQDMIRRGCVRNVITYSSLISACEKAGRVELAFELFNQMHAESCRPNVVTYNSLIACCAHGDLWEKASELFEQMQACGCQPDSITYSSLINAFEKGGQWRRGLEAYEDMQAQGLHPDPALFNSLMEVLWQSGVALAQLRALQLWGVANKNGQIRIYTNSQAAEVLQYSSVTFTAGAALVTLLRWLSELKAKMKKEGPNFGHEMVSFTLHKSKQNRVEQPLSTLNEAVSGMLKGSASPFELHTTNQSIVLQTSSSDLVAWLYTPQFNNLVFLADLAQVKKISLDVIFQQDLAMGARCAETFSMVKRIEDNMVMNVSNYCRVVLQQREQVVALAMSYGVAFGIEDDFMYSGLQLFDKLMCRSPSLPASVMSHWPLCLCVCILLKAKEWGLQTPSYDQVQVLTGFSIDVLISMESHVLEWCDGDLSAVSVLRVVQIYLERLGHRMQEYSNMDGISGELPSLLMKVACSPLGMGIRPSAVAAAVLVALRRKHGQVPYWPMALELMTGYANVDSGDLAACISHFELMLSEAGPSNGAGMPLNPGRPQGHNGTAEIASDRWRSADTTNLFF